MECVRTVSKPRQCKRNKRTTFQISVDVCACESKKYQGRQIRQYLAHTSRSRDVAAAIKHLRKQLFSHTTPACDLVLPVATYPIFNQKRKSNTNPDTSASPPSKRFKSPPVDVAVMLCVAVEAVAAAEDSLRQETEKNAVLMSQLTERDMDVLELQKRKQIITTTRRQLAQRTRRQEERVKSTTTTDLTTGTPVTSGVVSWSV